MAKRIVITPVEPFGILELLVAPPTTTRRSSSRDVRTGSVDIPMAKSGFIITQEVFQDPTDGKLKLRTTKETLWWGRM